MGKKIYAIPDGKLFYARGRVVEVKDDKMLVQYDASFTTRNGERFSREWIDQKKVKIAPAFIRNLDGEICCPQCGELMLTGICKACQK